MSFCFIVIYVNLLEPQKIKQVLSSLRRPAYFWCCSFFRFLFEIRSIGISIQIIYSIFSLLFAVFLSFLFFISFWSRIQTQNPKLKIKHCAADFNRFGCFSSFFSSFDFSTFRLLFRIQTNGYLFCFNRSAFNSLNGFWHLLTFPRNEKKKKEIRRKIINTRPRTYLLQTTQK